MSLKVEDIKVGDMLVCTTSSDAAVEPGVVIGKFLVLAKERSEANNNKSSDNTVLTLHIMYRNHEGSKYGHRQGSNFDIALEYFNHEVYSWNLEYRPEGKEVVQSGVSWEEPEPNENVGLNTAMRDC